MIGPAIGIFFAALVFFWLSAGYLGARFVNASGFGHWWSNCHGRYCTRTTCDDWYWDRPVGNDGGLQWFAFGVIAGPLTIGFCALGTAFYVIVNFNKIIGSFLKFVGEILAPQ